MSTLKRRYVKCDFCGREQEVEPGCEQDWHGDNRRTRIHLVRHDWDAEYDQLPGQGMLDGIHSPDMCPDCWDKLIAAKTTW